MKNIFIEELGFGISQENEKETIYYREKNENEVFPALTIKNDLSFAIYYGSNISKAKTFCGKDDVLEALKNYMIEIGEPI